MQNPTNRQSVKKYSFFSFTKQYLLILCLGILVISVVLNLFLFFKKTTIKNTPSDKSNEISSAFSSTTPDETEQNKIENKNLTEDEKMILENYIIDQKITSGENTWLIIKQKPNEFKSIIFQMSGGYLNDDLASSLQKDSIKNSLFQANAYDVSMQTEESSPLLFYRPLSDYNLTPGGIVLKELLTLWLINKNNEKIHVETFYGRGRITMKANKSGGVNIKELDGYESLRFERISFYNSKGFKTYEVDTSGGSIIQFGGKNESTYWGIKYEYPFNVSTIFEEELEVACPYSYDTYSYLRQISSSTSPGITLTGVELNGKKFYLPNPEKIDCGEIYGNVTYPSFKDINPEEDYIEFVLPNDQKGFISLKKGEDLLNIYFTEKAD